MPSEKRRRNDPWYVRYTLVTLTLGIIGLLILLPLVNLFAQAFADVSFLAEFWHACGSRIAPSVFVSRSVLLI